MNVNRIRAGAYALLSVGLINAVYQHNDASVIITAVVSALVAIMILVFSMQKRADAWLEKSSNAAIIGTIIAIGIVANLVK